MQDRRCYVCSMNILLSRRALILAGAALSVTTGAGAFPANAPARLRTIPTRLYRAPFNARETLDGWVFFLILETPGPEPVTPLSLRIDYRAAGTTVREERIGGPALAAMARQDISPARLTGQAPDPAVFWPQAIRVHCYVPHTPTVDELVLSLRVAGADGRAQEIEGRMAIVDFRQRTRLIFPFRGHGIISQAGVLSGGHRNRSGGFAIDALGLDERHAPMLRPGSDRPQDYAGWGRPIIAPAAGTIVRARSDRPDQPRDGVSDPAFFAPEYPGGGDVGNHVVIDHGQSEFSLIAHMRAGSVRVRAGDIVAQGQPLGALGNSGDTSGPHMHYQLQDGPRWEYADGLPVRFENVPSLLPGAYFTAA